MLLVSLKAVRCKTVCLPVGRFPCTAVFDHRTVIPFFLARILCVDAYVSFCSVKLEVA